MDLKMATYNSSCFDVKVIVGRWGRYILTTKPPILSVRQERIASPIPLLSRLFSRQLFQSWYLKLPNEDTILAIPHLSFLARRDRSNRFTGHII